MTLGRPRPSIRRQFSPAAHPSAREVGGERSRLAPREPGGHDGAPAAAQTETIEYYGTDAVGSVCIVFNASGAVPARQDYGPFGQEILSASGMSPERFGGQTVDGEMRQLTSPTKLASIPNPTTLTLVGVTMHISLDRFGNAFFGIGPNVGKSSLSSQAQWLHENRSHAHTISFLSTNGFCYRWW